MKNKILCTLMSIVMIVAMMPAIAFAEEDIINAETTQVEEEVQEVTQTAPQSVSGSGTVESPWEIGADQGDTVKATLEDGFLDISGKGKMMDFEPDSQPWAGSSVYSVYFNTDENNGITNIGANAFYGCSKLTYIDISSDVTTIGAYAFAGASTIRVINVPESVTNIADGAFSNCSNLARVVLASNTPATLGNNVFSEGTKVVVPVASLNAYQASWNTYSSALASICALNIPKTTGGEVKTDSIAIIYAGDTVTLKVLPDKNYELQSIEASYNQGAEKCDLTPTTITEDEVQYAAYTFTMPPADVSVNAVFKRVGAPEDPVNPTMPSILDGLKQLITTTASVFINVSSSVIKIVSNVGKAIGTINQTIFGLFRRIF